MSVAEIEVFLRRLPYLGIIIPTNRMQYVGVCPGTIPDSIGLIAINSDVGEGKAKEVYSHR
ncbi:hypothetical protein DPMN_041013 [Dreissena polymorpha]|uniref:Uncharacterized protein n=1 Tax=Dreissena polymorpha TaxID=45954 RepID=A0A9D4HVQ3_DREPO|nr:hypothetical protein DPMN_041013 [Dreissena polymorpha]